MIKKMIRKMPRKSLYSLGLGLITLIASTATWAHHSFAAAYDMNDAISITGKVFDVRLTNPHSHFFLDVEDDNGETVRWKFEAGTPGAMIRNGYSTEVIQKGDTVTISGFRARNASNNGMMRELVTADGTTFGMFGPSQGGGSR